MDIWQWQVMTVSWCEWAREWNEKPGQSITSSNFIHNFFLFKIINFLEKWNHIELSHELCLQMALNAISNSNSDEKTLWLQYHGKLHVTIKSDNNEIFSHSHCSCCIFIYIYICWAFFIDFIDCILIIMYTYNTWSMVLHSKCLVVCVMQNLFVPYCWKYNWIDLKASHL